LRQVSEQTALRYAVSLKQLEPELIPLFIDEIDKTTCIKIVKRRREGGASTATIRRDLTALSSVLEYAEDQDYREGNPALARLRKLKERRDPIVLPEHDHIERVAKRTTMMFAALIRVAVRTGCRETELTKAERRNYDPVKAQLTVRGKGKKTRTINLDDATNKTLRELPVFLGSSWLFWHDDGDRFTSPASNFRRLVQLELKAAQKSAQQQGLKECDFRPMRFHDLRHRHAVDWLKELKSIYDLQKRLGHTSIKTTEIYLEFLTPEEARIVKGETSQNPAQEQRSDEAKSA
jgi:integrase/recombinase XerD